MIDNQQCKNEKKRKKNTYLSGFKSLATDRGKCQSSAVNLGDLRHRWVT